MAIHFDVKTLVLILGLTHLMQVLVFFYQYKATRNYEGIGWWLLWSLAEVVGFAFMLSREIPGMLPVAIIGQNSMIVAGTIFIYIGVRRFFGQKVNFRFLIVIAAFFLIGLLYFLFIDDKINARGFIISAALATISLVTAQSLYANKIKAINHTANFLMAVFLFHGGLFVFRAVMIFSGAAADDVFNPELFNFLPYFDALIVSLLWTFGFIIMLNQRLNVEMVEARAVMQQIFNTGPDASIITRLDDGQIVDVNEGYLNISGYSHEETAGKSTSEINLWKNTADRQKVVDQLSLKGFCINFEAVFVNKDGGEIIGLLSAKIINIQGIPHIISIVRDITDRKQVELEILKKNEELLRLNIEKDRFFSIIAHDLRSPFNSFLGLTRMMVDDLPLLRHEEIEKMALTMRNSAAGLFVLLENLLEWSRIEQGLIPFNPVVIKLYPVVDQCLNLMLEPARIKGIEITIDVPVETTVFADANMLQTVIRNFLSNAMKFTSREGKIALSARNADGNKVEISIIDNGIGMSSFIIEKLFLLDPDTTRKGTEGEPSTGLGLLLCKEFVEKHGGEIRIESQLNKGSVFSFTLQDGVNAVN